LHREAVSRGTHERRAEQRLFGVPVRKLVNQTFLMLLLARGLDAAILDPCDRQLMANVAAAEALLGRDEYCERYLRAFRAGRLEAPGPEGGDGRGQAAGGTGLPGRVQRSTKGSSSSTQMNA